MPRVCQRMGCGKPLLTRRGDPDYTEQRRFCSKGCADADKAERMAGQRALAARAGRCPTCGKKWTHPLGDA